MDQKQDRLSEFMFGSRRESEDTEQRENEDNEQQESTLPNIDYGQLMYNIDTLMESTKSLKPLFQKAYPFIENFWKNK